MCACVCVCARTECVCDLVYLRCVYTHSPHTILEMQLIEMVHAKCIMQIQSVDVDISNGYTRVAVTTREMTHTDTHVTDQKKSRALTCGTFAKEN